MANEVNDQTILRKLEAEIVRAGSARLWAKDNDFSPSFVCDVLQGRRNVTDRLAAALGFESARLWKEK